MKSQPTSVRIPTGELLCVWVSESLSPYLSTSPLLSSFLVFSLPLVLHHFGAGVRTQPCIGKLHPRLLLFSPSPPPPPSKPGYWH